MKYLKIILWLNLGFTGAAVAQVPDLPNPSYDLTLTAPISTWDEAIPLGNGLTGGLLWGENNTIKLSLDRGDLWDERYFG